MTTTLKPNQRGGCLRFAIGLPLLLLCGVLTAFAFIPAPEDTAIPLALQGGGARQESLSVSGLQAAWPQMPASDPEQAELGRLLFYDPLLSSSDTIACATCHHPDLGFADGRPLALGVHGDDLRRGAPSLWNAAFATRLFWDGRADSLETQALAPLLNVEEMGMQDDAELETLLEDLRANDTYVNLFDAAFEDGITTHNVVTALAAFERTLVTQNSAFDRYAAGDADALTPAQRRGFDIFRSAQTRCFECHTWPTFSDDEFHVLGVPDADPDMPDLGRVEIERAPDAERAFRTPGLRNVALTAPYMHSGVFPNLDEVINFYEDGGGGPGINIPLDEKLRGFRLTTQQQADLVAFLQSLTDEPSELVTIPESVPSGLAVVQPLENTARQDVIASAPEQVDPAEPREPQTHVVQAGELIQPVVDRAQPGDTVLVEPGTYYETVYVDTPGLTIRGQVEGDQRPWLDGQDLRSDGFNTTGDDFLLEGFGIRNYIGNGVLTTGAERVVYRDLIIQDTGIYGLYPVEVTDVLIENVVATGIADAAIYVGQSRGPIIVRNNEVYNNVTGIEIENSVDAEVYDNYVHDNTGGILVFLLPNTPSKVGYNTRIHDNLIENNNHANFAAENAIVGLVPPGTGILIISADYTEIYDNIIRGNQTSGVGLTSLYNIYPSDTVFELGPIPEYNWIHDNIFENNGYDAQGEVAELGLPGTDILWTGEGWTNSFDQPGASTFPPLLPGRHWPDPARRALWRTYDTLIGALLG